jgi:DNA-binding response OmpR family regulator
MIVDDLPQVTYTVKYGLEKLDPNYSVIEVDSGKKCIELLESNQLPDLILLDIMMPEMNGWKVAKALQKKFEWKKIPIIFLTATEDETSRITGSIIAEDYIVKPFEITDLKKKIDKILKRKS